MTPQSVLDALADAETLRLYSESADSELSPFLLAKADARRGRGLNSLAYLIRRGREWAAGRLAEECAHWAFIIVPDLGGE